MWKLDLGDFDFQAKQACFSDIFELRLALVMESSLLQYLNNHKENLKNSHFIWV